MRKGGAVRNAILHAVEEGRWRTKKESLCGALPDGLSIRVAALGAFGNAIVPQVAAEFVMAAMNRPE